MEETKLTGPQRRAVIALGDAVKADGHAVTPSRFAQFMWPGKTFARGNGPWGLGPDASGRHGGRMLTTLHKLGLSFEHDHEAYYTAELSFDGKRLYESTSSGSTSKNGEKN